MNTIKSIPYAKTSNRRLPTWTLWAGLLGIVNFLVGWWSLLTPDEDRTVYFWFVQFYSYVILPSLILLPVSLLVVMLWFGHLTERSWAQATIAVLGIVVILFISIFALSGMFLSTLRMVGHVTQNGQVFYLVKYDDDRANDYAFCKSNNFGFSGHCKYIAWKSGDSDPRIYIDPNTNLITVKSENPSFTWINSIPPTCMNDAGKSNEKKYPVYVGACTP